VLNNEQDIENNRIKKRYLKNFQYERQRVINCDRLYNKRYYEKRKLNLVKKNCDIAEKIIRKYKKFWSQNYIKFRNQLKKFQRNLILKITLKND